MPCNLYRFGKYAVTLQVIHSCIFLGRNFEYENELISNMPLFQANTFYILDDITVEVNIKILKLSCHAYL